MANTPDNLDSAPEADEEAGSEEQPGQEADDSSSSSQSRSNSPGGRGGNDDAGEDFDSESARKKITKTNSENANLRKRLKELEPLAQKAKELEDANKSEVERLSEASETYKSRAETSETQLKKYQAAFDNAPDGASVTQIKAVAKRIQGDSDEDLETDAQELFELLSAQSSGDSGPKVPAKPKEAPRGGGEPDDEPEETDPAKLADKIGRAR